MSRWLWGVTVFVAGIGFVCLAVFVYLRFGTPPVAVTDSALPFEKPSSKFRWKRAYIER